MNVATALAKVAPSQTLFADLHVAHGDAALLFGAEPRFSIVDALENTHRFDEAFFRGLVTPTKAGAALLASSDRALVQHAGMQQFRAVVEFAAQLYRYVDPRRARGPMPPPSTRSTPPRASSSSRTRSCRRCAAPAGWPRRCASATGATACWSIVSRFDKQAEISQADIEKVVASKVKHMLPSDYRLALQALNKGRPLALDNHNKLAAGFRSLAKELAKIDPEPKQQRTAAAACSAG